jgi:Holliday junction DNA helicase RuvB
MNPPSRIVTPEPRSDDVGDTALRPQLLSEFVGQAQAAVAIASASRSAGEKAKTAQLIRLGLKELAK